MAELFLCFYQDVKVRIDLKIEISTLLNLEFGFDSGITCTFRMTAGFLRSGLNTREGSGSGAGTSAGGFFPVLQ